MSGASLKICIYGAGAIGGYLGYGLAKSGVDVSLVARGAHLAAIKANGLRLIDASGEGTVSVRATDNPEELGAQDYLVIALKAHTIPDAVERMRSLVGPETCVVCAYNGVPYWFTHGLSGAVEGKYLSSIDPDGAQWRILGPERALGCVVLPATEIIAPGVIRHDHGDKFPIGEPSGATTARIERLHTTLEAAGFKAPIRSDIRDEIWLKLWGNLCLNPIATLTHATIDIIATDPATRAVCRSMMQEAAAIAERIGVRTRVDLERRLDGAAAVGAHKMSMLQDLERGRSLEVDPLVGVIQELGHMTGVPTPVVDILLALVRQRAMTAAAALAA